jgi:adenosylmethionine-8-amino-7-oxononanoate aminotransferase
VAVNIGHSVPEVIEDISRVLSGLDYVHNSHFRTRVGEELATLLAGRFPSSDNSKVLFTSGGSEATESAIKLVRQYWLSRKQPNRYKIISRWHGYHGATLGALGLSGNLRRRAPYLDLLPTGYHTAACFCYHCALGLEYPACGIACAEEFEQSILREGPGTVAGVILEPVVGATSGAVPPDGYLRRVREICDCYDLPLIADEIMTGSGRTGRYFAVDHWNIRPDLILMGKGLSSGYSPLGAVLVAENIWRPLQQANVSLEHSFTYQCHPPSLAAALSVQQYLIKHNLIDQAARRGGYLGRKLAGLRRNPSVGDVRGLGLLWTVEFVADSRSRIPYPLKHQISERLFETLRNCGLILYPAKGTLDGIMGDHVLIAPPFIIEESEIDFLVETLNSCIEQVFAAVRQAHLSELAHDVGSNRSSTDS